MLSMHERYFSFFYVGAYESATRDGVVPYFSSTFL